MSKLHTHTQRERERERERERAYVCVFVCVCLSVCLCGCQLCKAYLVVVTVNVPDKLTEPCEPSPKMSRMLLDTTAFQNRPFYA